MIHTHMKMGKIARSASVQIKSMSRDNLVLPDPDVSWAQFSHHDWSEIGPYFFQTIKPNLIGLDLYQI